MAKLTLKHKYKVSWLKTAILLPLTIFNITGCSSGTKRPVYEEDRVVARSEGLSQRPDWVKESKSVYENGDKIVFLGMVEVPGDSRAQAAWMASDSNARGQLANKIETQVTKVVETSNKGFAMEDQGLKSIIREISSVKFRQLEISDRYWEKVVSTLSSGEERMVLKAFSKIEINKDDLKKKVIESLSESSNGDQKTSGDLRNQVEDLLRKNWNVDEIAK